MPKPKTMMSAETVRKLVDYDPSTGAFTWKERGMTFFATDVARRKWNTRFAGKSALCTLAHNGYLYGAIFGENWSSHRIAWLHQTGQAPREIDHINGDRADNRLENLREVDRTTNCKNLRRRNNLSGATGISWHVKGKSWAVKIGKKHVGLFKDFDAAVAARKAAEAANGYHPNHGREAALKEA